MISYSKTPGRSVAARRAALLSMALLCASAAAMPVGAQEPKSFPSGFTLVRQVTDYDKAGREFPAHSETLYVSSSGDWRFVAIYANGQTFDTIYLCGRGVFFTDHRNKQLVKMGEVGGRPGPTAAGQLQADPKFVRSEYVLGRLAYLHRRDNVGYVEETYFAPEIGPFPFKRVSHLRDMRREEVPVSVTFAEPEAAQLRPADFPLVTQRPVQDPKLGERFEEKPEPHYPAEARAAGLSGVVEVQVIVDEEGRVARAVVVGGAPLLGEAALEAANRARFTPQEREGKPVKVTGRITYQFPAPQPSPEKAAQRTHN